MDTKRMTGQQARELLEAHITSDIIDALDVLIPEQSARSPHTPSEELYWNGGRRSVVLFLKELL